MPAARRTAVFGAAADTFAGLGLAPSLAEHLEGACSSPVFSNVSAASVTCKLIRRGKVCRCVWPSTDYVARSLIGDEQLVATLLL